MTDAPSAPSKPEKMQARWRQELERAEKDRKVFIDEGKKVVERYRNEGTGPKKIRKRGMPILFSNTEQLQSALYSKAAKPDVRRRFSDRDPVGQQVAEMIERALTYFDDMGKVDNVIEATIQDYLLPGRGICRIEYEPVIGQKQTTDPLTGQLLFEVDVDGEVTDEAATIEFIADQKIHHQYTFWQDFLASPSRRWADVSWVAFRHIMDRDQLGDEIYDAAPNSSKTYGKASDVPVDWSPETEDRTKDDDPRRRAEVWEIWDKTSTKRIWLVKSHDRPLRVDDDPYGLDGFFPLPEPLASYRTNDSIVPQAPFKAYEDQAEDLDEICRRISMLTRAMKRRGIYDQSIPELKRLANAGDNEFIPSTNYKNLATSGGLAAAMQTEDISVLASVLMELSKQRDAMVQIIYEITGVSDIMRGSSDPDETLGAQQLKSQFGSLRLRKMQQAVQRMVRDLNRIKVDLMCRHFQPEILQKITNMQVTPEIMQTLQSDDMRGYRIDIETDSTVFADQAAQQQERTALLTGITQLMTGMGPIVQQRPEAADLMFEMLKFGIAPAHDARPLEDAIDELQQKLQSAPQQPNPAQAGEQAKAQAEQVKGQAQSAVAQASVQSAMIAAQAEQAKGQADIQSAQIGAQAEMAKAQSEAQIAAQKASNDQAAHAMDQQRSQQAHEQAMAQSAQAHEQAMRQKALAGPQLRPDRGRV